MCIQGKKTYVFVIHSSEADRTASKESGTAKQREAVTQAEEDSYGRQGKLLCNLHVTNPFQQDPRNTGFMAQKIQAFSEKCFSLKLSEGCRFNPNKR